MQEIIISVDKEGVKTIALLQNGILTEIQEQKNENKYLEGNIYLGKVQNVLKGMQAAFVDIGENKNTFIHLKDILPKVDITKEKEDITGKNIERVIKPEMSLLVQVKKDNTDKKGAKVSTHISIPSRFFVLMPDTDIITVSQKIEIKEKEKLIDFVKQYLPKKMGVIIRTSAEGKQEKELLDDLHKLINRWEIIQKRLETTKEIPSLIQENAGILSKMIIDTYDNGLKKITVNTKQEKERVEKILEELEVQIELILEEKENILSHYELSSQIEKLKNRKIWLKCGGFITIDRTEALTAIDVNSGKYIGKESLEQTVLKVNREAAIEIAKQVRLRDIGGIIIIDFIDMNLEEDKKEILSILEENLKADRSKTQVVGFTKLNLVEMTRKHIYNKEGEI